MNRNDVLGWLCASLIVFSLLLSGCVISPRRNFGGGGTPTPTPTPSGTPTPTPGGPPEGKLYVSNLVANSIVRFDQALSASGNIVPGATISGGNTKLDGPAYITLDVANDRLYVANSSKVAPSILIFDTISAKTADAAPERRISGTNTILVSPTDVALDKTRDLLYVADDINIHVFASASTATGDIAPARNLSPGFVVSALFIDAANDRLYAANQAGAAIAVYDNASGLASGSITASRTLQGANTHLAKPSGIQIDSAGRLVVSNAMAPSITIYNNAAGVTGNPSPVAEIKGSNTGFNFLQQIVVDTSGTGSVYNIDSGAARVAVYNLGTATGNIAPNRVIVGPGTTLTATGQPVGIALDTTR